MEEQNQNKVEQVIKSALEKIKFLSGNQVVGTPIVNDFGQTVIPLSSVTVAVFSGGGEYGGVKASSKLSEKFAGGNVTICSLKPDSFIINNGKGFTVSKNSDMLNSVLSAINQIGETLKK